MVLPFLCVFPTVIFTLQGNLEVKACRCNRLGIEGTLRPTSLVPPFIYPL